MTPILHMSVAGVTSSKLATSGAMKSIVPAMTCWPLAGLYRTAKPKSMIFIRVPVLATQTMFSGYIKTQNWRFQSTEHSGWIFRSLSVCTFMSRWRMCWSWMKDIASTIWRMNNMATLSVRSKLGSTTRSNSSPPSTLHGIKQHLKYIGWG